MIRFLNIVAIAALVGSAIYAYTIKYDTIFRAEEINKLRYEIKAARDSIEMARAEWAHLARPERIEALADRFLDLRPPTAAQVVRIDELPEKAPKVDGIGRKLDALGLGEPTNTPQDRSARGQTTPTTTPR
jgi:cell division protein FtsL